MKKLMYAALLIPVALGANSLKSTSFASSGPTCSGSDTVDTVRNILDENVFNMVRVTANHEGDIAVNNNIYNVLRAEARNGTVDEKVINIITTDKTDRRSSCKFDIEMKFTGRDTNKTRRWSEYNGAPQLGYTAELTDDDKLYVTVYGLN